MLKLNKRNYYGKKANQEYMSYSQFKDFCKCPACAMAKIRGEWKDEETESLLVGSYVDAWLDGEKELENFAKEHPEIFNSRTGELKAGFQKAKELCSIIEKDKYFYNRLKGKRQKIFTCNIAGVPFKCKCDSLHPDSIDDGKVLKDCEDAWNDEMQCYASFIYVHRYDLQAAIYTTAVKQNLMKDLPFRLDVITKEKVPDKRIFLISENIIKDALQEVIAKAPEFQAMKLGAAEAYRCEHCDYCKATKIMSKEYEEKII